VTQSARLLKVLLSNFLEANKLPLGHPLERAYSTSTNALLWHRTGNVSGHEEDRPISNIPHHRSRPIKVQVCTKDLKLRLKTELLRHTH
jgi:hypothetical protein